MVLGVTTVTDAAHEEQQRRRRDKEETRARVVDAARSLFSREGFQKVTIRMIAEEAGVATGSVFITFTSKDELCDEIISEFLVDLSAKMGAAAEQSSGQPLAARLMALASVALDAPAERMTFIREAIAASWVRPEQAERKIRQAGAGICEAVERVLADAAGELQPGLDRKVATDVLVMLALSCFRASLADNHGNGSMRERLRQQIATLTTGWRTC